MGVRGIAFALLALAPALAWGSGAAEQADRVVIEKSKRRLTLYAGGRALAAYMVALGREPVGRKLCRGDKRTPEGTYTVSGRKADSDFHRALRISYPSPEDEQRARAWGCDPGGDIMIHGLKNGDPTIARFHEVADWTMGCVAVTNDEIEQIWRLVPDGAQVEIRP